LHKCDPPHKHACCRDGLKAPLLVHMGRVGALVSIDVKWIRGGLARSKGNTRMLDSAIRVEQLATRDGDRRIRRRYVKESCQPPPTWNGVIVQKEEEVS